ncbi:MAG: hypothetical protein ACXVXJ_08030 [Mycobacteriaceae bacterium]
MVLVLLVVVGAATAPASGGSALAAAPARGNLDCNGLSTIQQPLRQTNLCSDFRLGSQRGEDNGVYIGHDEPSVQFLSTVPGSGNNVRWQITLPTERPLPATQTFENYPAFWLSMALCDPGSYPHGRCIPNSDANDPNLAGSAFLEMQFYPPGFSPFISKISCDLRHWCASLHINSVECTAGFAFCNDQCIEPTNFAFIQDNGVPTGPAGPTNATNATFTPNGHTLRMNPGDRLNITIRDTRAGVINQIRDLTNGRSGFMVASKRNGFQSLHPRTCEPRRFAFHPEFSTAKPGNYVPWAVLQANVGFAAEIGHFQTGLNGDGDADDPPCFPGPTIPGCLNFAQGGDVDFDGTSYQADWPDGTASNATSLLIGSITGSGVGPMSFSRGVGYVNPFPSLQFETTVPASESTCTPTGAGCTVPPAGAAFYPFYSQVGSGAACRFAFGNVIAGQTTNSFGKTAQYGGPNLPWFFGEATGGPGPNPCTPPAG